MNKTSEDRLMHFMYKDDVVCDVWYNFSTDTVRFKNYSSNWMVLPFGKCKDDQVLKISNLLFALDEYVFPETQADCKKTLKSLGLDFYDRFEIVRKTHGVVYNQFTWIKFDDDPPGLMWKDVAPIV